MDESRIIAVVPFYNAKNYIKECYESLINQQYTNFRLIFLDDCSSDHSAQLIPEDDKRVQKRRSAQRNNVLKNVYTLLSCEKFHDEDIIVIVDGDDFLLHDHVFYMVNQIYKKKKCLVSYGQYCTINGKKGHCRPYSREEFHRLRTLDWRASHLKSFKYTLYRTFLRLDPQLKSYHDEEGRFYEMSNDVALMHPLLEIAGYENVYFNEDILYVYRTHACNNSIININKQFSNARSINAKPSFERVFF